MSIVGNSVISGISEFRRKIGRDGPSFPHGRQQLRSSLQTGGETDLLDSTSVPRASATRTSTVRERYRSSLRGVLGIANPHSSTDSDS